MTSTTVKEVEALCQSPELSLDALREKIESLPPDLAIPSPSFLHHACLSKNISLDIVQYLLDMYPNAPHAIAEFRRMDQFGRDDRGWRTSAYPLHIACGNEHCPSSIIALLMRENPLALRQMCLVDEGINDSNGNCDPALGLPVHYYLDLMRSANIDFDTVRMLVDAYPESLMVQDDSSGVPFYAPIHCLVDNPYADGPLMMEIIQYFFKVNPQCFRLTGAWRYTPVHYALLHNKRPEVVLALLEFWPESVSQGDYTRELPIHYLSHNTSFDDGSSVKLLSRFLTYGPESAMERTDEDEDCLPIHYAAASKSPAFCKMLIDAFPESVSIMSGYRGLPLHMACYNAVDTVKYLFDLYPEAVHAEESNPARNRTPLEIVKAKERDIHPASPDGRYRSGYSKESIAAFLEAQLKYANIAQDAEAMATEDHNGWLPLHQALRDNVSLGTVKLLVRGYPAALESPGVMEIAYEFSSLDVVQLLVQLSGSRLDHCGDLSISTPLHLACRGRNLDVAKYLLEECPSSVSKRNADKKLPIHLLCESSAGEIDNDSPEYSEVVWLMLLAHPEVLKSR